MTTAGLSVAFPPVSRAEDRPVMQYRRFSFTAPGTGKMSPSSGGGTSTDQAKQTQSVAVTVATQVPELDARPEKKSFGSSSLRRGSRVSGERRASLKVSQTLSLASDPRGSKSSTLSSEHCLSPTSSTTDGIDDSANKLAAVPCEWRLLGDGRRLSHEQYLSITAPLSQANWPGKPHTPSGTSRVASIMIGALSKPLKRMRSTKKPGQPHEETTAGSSSQNPGPREPIDISSYTHMDYSHLKNCDKDESPQTNDGKTSTGSQSGRVPTTTRVVKSGLMKMAVHRMGRTQWKLRNIELCWDSHADSPDVLRLTVFPARGEKAHKRHDIVLRSGQSVQVVSEKFPGKHVVHLPSESDYYFSAETEEALIDWVATLKASLAKTDEEPRSLYHVTSLPGQKKAPSGNLLVSFKEGSIILQSPVTEVMVYMTNMTSIAAFGANWRSLTWWFEVFTHRRRSASLPINHRFSFSSSSVQEIMNEMVTHMETAHGAMALSECDGEIVYRVSLHDGVSFPYESLCATSAPASASNALDGDHDGHSPIPICTSPQLTQPPKALITQLRERQSKVCPGLQAKKKCHSESEISSIASTASAPRPAVVALKPPNSCLPPPKPPRSNEGRLRANTMFSPPHSAATSPPADSGPAPTPRPKPEKPKRSSTSSLGSRASQLALLGISDELDATLAALTTSTGSISSENSGSRKPTPAPRTKPKPSWKNVDGPRKALLPPTSRHPAGEADRVGGGSELLYQNTPALGNSCANPAMASHDQLQEKTSGSSDFAYDYVIAVGNDGDVLMHPAPCGETQRKASQTSNAVSSISSHHSSEFCNHSPETSSHSESEESVPSAFAKNISCSEDSEDSDTSFTLDELSSAPLKKIIGSLDLDSDGELCGLRLPLQRDPPDGQEETKNSPDSTATREKRKVSGHGAADDVEVDHLYMNFQRSRLPRGESDDES